MLQSPWVAQRVQSVGNQSVLGLRRASTRYFSPLSLIDLRTFSKNLIGARPPPLKSCRRAGRARRVVSACHASTRRAPSSIRFSDVEPQPADLDLVRSDLAAILNALLLLGASAPGVLSAFSPLAPNAPPVVRRHYAPRGPHPALRCTPPAPTPGPHLSRRSSHVTCEPFSSHTLSRRLVPAAFVHLEVLAPPVSGPRQRLLPLIHLRRPLPCATRIPPPARPVLRCATPSTSITRNADTRSQLPLAISLSRITGTKTRRPQSQLPLRSQ